MGTGIYYRLYRKGKYQISPLSFYQVNPVQTEKLYSLALEYAGLTGEETVWDLYCGIGTISLFLAQKAKKVYGVEIVPEAIADAKNNAKINGIENAEFFVGKSEEVLPEYYEKYAKEHPGEHAHADVIVVDPPRKGCEEKSAPHHGRYAAGSDCVCLVRFCDTGKGSEDSSGAGV